MSASLTEAVVVTKGVTKEYKDNGVPVRAVRGIDLEINKGEFTAIVGPSGSGKSTLMNIIYSLYRQDEGTIFVKGEQIEFSNPNDAIRNGIGMVHQHFMLVPVMTVTENIMLGVEEMTGSVYVGAVIAALLGAGFGFLLGGPVGLIVWLLVAGLYVFLSILGFRPGIGTLPFGLLTGAGAGILYFLIVQNLLGIGQQGILVPILLGLTVGTAANLRWIDKKTVTF